MYDGLSNDFKRIMKLPAQRYVIKGTIDSIPIGPKNIVQNSVSISNRCSDNNDISIGQVYIGQLNIILVGLNIPRGTYRGLEIVLKEGLLIDEESDTWEEVPLGVFTIEDPQYTNTGVEIVAYDNMAKFDKEVSNMPQTGTLYTFISYACENCLVNLGMTEAQIQAMPNGTETLDVYSSNDIKTYRDLLSWCAQTMGANALITREGELIFKNYDDTPIEIFGAKDRIEGSRCSDFSSYYTEISMVNMDDQSTSYYSTDPNDGLMMELGSNPLLQSSESSIENKRRRILTAISKINYTPFTSRIHRPFIYDLMDVIELTGGIVGSDNVLTCIVAYQWNYLNGYTIQCFGSNPALASAKSRTDRSISEIVPIITEVKEEVMTISDDIDGITETIENITDDIDGITDNITTITESIDGKQNDIPFTTTMPSGGEDGDIAFYSSDGGQTYTPYVNNNGTWTPVNLAGTGSNLITYGTSDMSPGVTPLATGTVYLMYE